MGQFEPWSRFAGRPLALLSLVGQRDRDEVEIAGGKLRSRAWETSTRSRHQENAASATETAQTGWLFQKNVLSNHPGASRHPSWPGGALPRTGWPHSENLQNAADEIDDSRGALLENNHITKENDAMQVLRQSRQLTFEANRKGLNTLPQVFRKNPVTTKR